MRNKHFDLIIANPPYAKVGAEITKFIVDNIDYDEFINLLPASDYVRAKGLINHVDMTSLKKVESGFEDAAVDTWIARVVKKHMPITEESFTLFTYDEKLRNCYEEFASREHYAIDSFVYSVNYYQHYDGIAVDNTFAITRRTNQNGVHYDSYQKALVGKVNSKTAFDVKWNLLENVTTADLHLNNDSSTVDFIKFNTAEEKKNFADWWYNGKLSNMLIKGLNRQSGTSKPALPRVDWTRPWTDEEILADCGYTEEEIARILA